MFQYVSLVHRSLSIATILLTIVGQHFAYASDESKSKYGIESQATVGKPLAYFRWIQTDPKTAEGIISAIAAKQLSAENLALSIDKAITQGRVTELARFAKEFHTGVAFDLSAGNEPIKAGAQGKNDTPIKLKIEISSEKAGFVSMRYSASRQSGKPASGQAAYQECSTTSFLRNSAWTVLQRWQNSRDASLLLARVVYNTPNPEPAPSDSHKSGSDSAELSVPLLHLEVEMRETPRSSLDQIAKACQRSPKVHHLMVTC